MRPEGLKWLKSGKDHHNFADFAGLKASQRWNLGANFRPVETRTAEGLKKSWDPQGSPSHDVMVVSGMIWDDDWGTYVTGNRNIICCCDIA